MCIITLPRPRLLSRKTSTALQPKKAVADDVEHECSRPSPYVLDWIELAGAEDAKLFQLS
jgi:hypothetical protein